MILCKCALAARVSVFLFRVLFFLVLCVRACFFSHFIENFLNEFISYTYYYYYKSTDLSCRNYGTYTIITLSSGPNGSSYCAGYVYVFYGSLLSINK